MVLFDIYNYICSIINSNSHNVNTIKLRVKDILKEKGITQKELASKLGMTEVGLSKAINEEGNPPLKRIGEIANALDVPVSDLFEQPGQDIITCPYCGGKIKTEKI